jgi:hypothetical protein
MAARLPAALRRTAGHRRALTATAVTVLVASVLAAAAATFAGEVTSAAVSRSLTQNPGSSILVTEPITAAGAAGAGQQVGAAVRRVLPGLPVAVIGSLRSQILNLPQPGRAHAGGPATGPPPAGQPAARRRPGRAAGVVAQTQIISLPGVTERAVLTSGSWPGPVAPAGGAVPVAVPVAAARLLRLAPGDRLVLRNDQTQAKVPVLVTGVFRPADPASPYWRLSPVGSPGVQRSDGFASYGPLVTSPAVAAGPGVPVTSGAWLAVPDFAAVGPGSLAALNQRLASGLGGFDVSSSSLTGLPQATVTTALPALISQLSTALLVARSQLLIGVLILLAVIGGAVAVSVRPLAAQREPEAALLAARGASRRQLATRGVTEALLLAAPAAIAGPWLGSRLGMLAARAGPLARAGLVPAGSGLNLTGGVPASAWLAGLAVAAGCAVIMALPWLRRPQSALRLRVAAGRQRPVTGAVLVGADLALVALAVLAGWQLARYRAPVATGVDGALGVDPLLAAAPVLALTAGTVVMLRLLPLATRLADAAAARQRGLAVALASWQLSRRPLGRVGPALLAVLAIAAAVIALAQHSSWQRSVADQAGFAVGADERVVLPPAAPLPLGQVARLTAAPGVTASTPAIRTQIGLPGGQNGTLLALDTRAASQVVPLRRDLAAAPPASLLAALAPAQPASGVPLPGRPARLSITAALRGAGHTGPAVLAVQLTDAAGLSYLLPAGRLPANGRAHQLTAVIATRPGVDYPLRLTGYTLAFSMPIRPTKPDVLAISSVRTAAAASSPFRPPLAAVAGDGLLVSTVAAEAMAANAALGPGGVTRPPAVISTGYADSFRGGITVTFATGAGNLFGEPGSPLVPASLTVTTQPAVAVLPGLATAGFLAATGQHRGATVQVSLNGVTLPVRLVGTIRAFPTLTGPGGLVVDQATLQDMLQAAGALPLPATEWWLRTSGRPVLTGLPAGTTIVRQASLARALAAQPLSAGPQQAMLGIAAAAVLLAIAGFAVNVVTAADRARDVALLDALGTQPGRVTGLLCLEQAVAAGLAIAAGLVLGAVLSRLIIPAVSLTAAATHPVPPVLVEIPWRLAVALAMLIVAVPTVAVAVAAGARGSTAARLRAEEDA